LALYNRPENEEFQFKKHESEDDEDMVGNKLIDEMAKRKQQVELLREETESRILETENKLKAQ
jgi:hypothetical protein